MLGLVTCIKHTEKKRYIIASDENQKFSANERESEIALGIGETFSTDDKDTIESAFITAEGAEKIIKSLDRAIERTISNKMYEREERIDLVTERLWERIKDASRMFLRKLFLGAPIIVRFHNDSDGASGAYALYLAVEELRKRFEIKPNIIWIMHKGASYTAFDASSDILIANNYESIEKQLLFIIDFGTTPDSNKAIDMARDKFDILWLDHHPPKANFKSDYINNYINPWLFNGDSNYTAGFLAIIFTKTFSNIDTREIEDASFIGDYSKFLEIDKADNKIATILDFLTSDSRIVLGYAPNGITPIKIDELLHDKKREKELFDYANIRLNESTDIATNLVKRHKAKEFDIFLLNFERVRSDDSKYPLPGRFSTKFMDKIREGTPRCIVIVYAGLFISIRVSKEICATIKLLELIEKLKEDYKDKIESGGGHPCAASIKLTDKSLRKKVTNALIEELRQSNATTMAL